MSARDRRLLIGVSIAMLAAQLWLMRRYFGFLTGDDVEVLAEAFRFAIGFRYRAWDIRNVFVPDYVAGPPVWLAHALGVRDPQRLIEAATLPFLALSVATVWLVHRLALRWTDDGMTANVAAVLFATHWIPLGFGATVYPRTVATFCVVLAALIARRFPLLAGALLGIAFADRFSEIVFLVPLVVECWRDGDDASHTRVARVVRVLAGAAVTIVLAVGIFDWVVWGAPFSSFVKFTRLTVLQPDFASRVKYQSPVWYLGNLFRWLAPSAAVLLVFGRRSVRWTYVLIPFVAFSVVKHKEMRYLQGLVPFLMIAAAAGFVLVFRRHRAAAVSLLALTIGWHLYGVRYFARKTQPAVLAAKLIAADPSIRGITMSQLWAYGDRMYLGDDRAVLDVGTPPQGLAAAIRNADAVALYESDVDDAIRATLAAAGFHEIARFDDGRARGVVVWKR